MAGLDPAILFGGPDKVKRGKASQASEPKPFCIRAMALPISASLQAKDNRIDPGAPKAVPGTVAT